MGENVDDGLEGMKDVREAGEEERDKDRKDKEGEGREEEIEGYILERGKGRRRRVRKGG